MASANSAWSVGHHGGHVVDPGVVSFLVVRRMEQSFGLLAWLLVKPVMRFGSRWLMGIWVKTHVFLLNTKNEVYEDVLGDIVVGAHARIPESGIIAIMSQLAALDASLRNRMCFILGSLSA